MPELDPDPDPDPDPDILPCDRCGRPTRVDDLDAKPSRRRWTLRWGFLPWRAPDEDADFDRLECPRCYGPGYSTLTGAPPRW